MHVVEQNYVPQLFWQIFSFCYSSWLVPGHRHNAGDREDLHLNKRSMQRLAP